MNLKTLREQWEKGGTEMLCIFEEAYGNKVIYVVTRFFNSYSLLRYFKINDDWNVSCDCREVTLETCLELISKDFANGIKKDME
jgi:hypothetical protein